MNDSPLVSILMLVYNQEQYIRDALQSIVTQKYKNFEVIISDDCSIDSSVSIIKDFIATHNIGCTITLNLNKENLGISKNFETGVALCRGQYICLAAGDDISADNRLSSSMSSFIDNPDLAAVFSNLKIIDESGSLKDDYFQEKPIYSRNLSDVIAGRPIWSIGASLCFKRDLLDKFSGFIPGTYQEDGVLAYRALLIGSFEFIAEPLVYYRVHSNNASQNISLEKKVFFKSQELYLIRNAIKDTNEFMSLNEDKEKILAVLRYRYFRLKILNHFLSINAFAKLAFITSNILRKMAFRR